MKEAGSESAPALQRVVTSESRFASNGGGFAAIASLETARAKIRVGAAIVRSDE